MLGNSFTFVNNMPEILAQLTGAEVVHHTRGEGHCSGDPGGLGAEKKKDGNAADYKSANCIFPIITMVPSVLEPAMV